MTDPIAAEEPTLLPRTVGQRLRDAREAQGLSLADIAARTRVPIRQLEAIELGNFAALPSITYAIGFAKAYARTVELDEAAVAREVRGASDQPGATRRTDYETYEIDEPSRVPTRGLAIGTLILALLLLVGVGLFYGTTLFRGEESPPPAPAPSGSAAPVATAPPAAAPPVTTAPAAPTGDVVLTATDTVWLKVYDRAGTTLFIGTLEAGDVYRLPVDAQGPMINVGRPDKVRVTVGGTPVAPLGDGRVAIKDVPIDAVSLAARAAPRPDAGPAPSAPATPTSSPTRRGSTRPVPAPGRPSDSAPPPLNIGAAADVPPEPSPSPSP